MRRWVGLLSAFCLMSLAVARQANEITLRLRYAPGQTLLYDIGLDGKITVVSEIGVATDLQFQGKLKQEQQVEEIADDGTATLLVTVNGTVQVNMGGTPAPGTPPSQQSNEMTIPQTRLRLKIAPNGRIVEMKPVPSEETSDGKEKEAVAPFLQDPFQALTLGTGAMSLLPAILPDRPVKVGDTWDLTANAPLPMGGGRIPVALKGMGKLLAVQQEEGRPVAVTEMRLEVPDLGDAIVKAMPLKEMGIDMQAKGGTKIVGKHWLDLSQGLLTRSEVVTETQMSTLIRMPENAGGGVMSLQSRTTVKTTMRLVEVKTAPRK
ncbi:MAG: hypothetical protein OXFUSZZB_000467 [Candidatus Fervidibacter sp.]|jgi:hypothetical protein